MIKLVFLSLRGSGSDAASLTTSAKRDGDYYILNGSKVKIKKKTVVIRKLQIIMLTRHSYSVAMPT